MPPLPSISASEWKRQLPSPGDGSRVCELGVDEGAATSSSESEELGLARASPLCDVLGVGCAANS